jgi:5-methyltetrahydropteroyltriglutamate--homocysteine methyltransferase
LTCLWYSTNFSARPLCRGSRMTLRSPGLYLASAGGYPRFGETHELLVLRRTMDALACGDRTSADLLDAQNAMTRLAIADQVEAGLDIITDGQIRWSDPISHIPAKLDNVRMDELLPFFTTGTYFRQPVLTGKVARRTHLVADEYSFARNALGHLPTPPAKAGKLAIKPVLTGPYTLAKYSLTENGNGSGHLRDTSEHLEARAQNFAEILAAEIEILARGGAQLIQIDEPAILYHAADWPIFEAALNSLVASRDRMRQSGRVVELALYTYFHDSAPLYEKLMALPVDVIGFDFTANGDALAERIAADGADKPIAFGLISGTAAELESAGDVARKLDKLLPRIAGGRAYLGAATGLEYLSRAHAHEKLRLLGKIKSLLHG